MAISVNRQQQGNKAITDAAMEGIDFTHIGGTASFPGMQGSDNQIQQQEPSQQDIQQPPISIASPQQQAMQHELQPRQTRAQAESKQAQTMQAAAPEPRQQQQAPRPATVFAANTLTPGEMTDSGYSDEVEQNDDIADLGIDSGYDAQDVDQDDTSVRKAVKREMGVGPQPSDTIKREVESVQAKAPKTPSGEPVNATRPAVYQVPQLNEISTKRFQKAKELQQEQAKNMVAEVATADSFYDKILCSTEVEPDEASIGTENVWAIIRTPGNKLLPLINEYTGMEFTAESDVNKIANAVNSVNIKVVFDKSPVNQETSSQIRILRIHYGRGILLHPTQAKPYNADYDGDAGTIQFDQANLSEFRDAMSYLIAPNGKPTIDSDYFPIIPIMRDRSETVGYIQDVVLGFVDADTKKIANAFWALTEAPTETNWIRLLKAMDSAARKSTNLSATPSNILSAIYNFTSDVHLTQMLGNSLSENSNYQQIEEPVDEVIYDVIDEIQMGSPALNFHDFCTRLSAKFVGDVKSGNVQFRTGAGVAKAIKFDERIIIGSDIVEMNEDGSVTVRGQEGLWKLFQATCLAGTAKQISERAYTGTIEMYEKKTMQKRVILEVGLPDYNPKTGRPYDTVQEFLEAFRKAFNAHQTLMDISASGMRTDFIPNRRNADDESYKTIESDKLIDYVTPLLKVYGDVTVGRFFNGMRFYSELKGGVHNTTSGILMKYRAMTLDQFAKNNKLRYEEAALKGERIDERGNKVQIDSYTVGKADLPKLAQAIANDRSGFASGFNRSLGNLFEETVGLLGRVRDMLEDMDNMSKDMDNRKRIYDFNPFINEVTNLLYLAGPDMYSYYGMDNPLGFIDSKWGRKMLNAKTADEIGSIWVSMQVEFRLDQVYQAHAKIDEVMQSEIGKYTETRKKELVEIYQAAYDNELTILGSSSSAWKLLMDERDSSKRNKVYNEIVENGSLWGSLNKNAHGFWSNKAKRFNSFEEVLRSDEIGFSEKMDILSDGVRHVEQFAYIGSHEMAAQLVADTSTLYEGVRWSGRRNPTSQSDAVKASIDRINGYKRKYLDEVQDNWEKFFAKDIKPAEFEQFIQSLDVGPDMDIGLLADAAIAAMDKDYADSEKTSQQDAVKAIFYGVSYARNGGYYTDVFRADNRALGMIGIDQLTEHDLIHFLANPDESVLIYDGYGNAVPLNRETIIGSNDPADMLQWFKDRPRMLLALRRNQVSVMSEIGKNSVIYTAAKMDTADSFDNRLSGTKLARRRAEGLLYDMPSFYAISSLLVPQTMESSRTVRNKVIASMEFLKETLEYYAIDKVVDPGSHFVEQIGFDVDSIVDVGVDEEIAERLRNRVIEEINEMVGVYANEFDDGQIRTAIEPTTWRKWLFDIASIESYYDTKQTLLGAKTETMTGVEGSETAKNMLLSFYTGTMEDQLIAIKDWMDDADLKEYAGCATSIPGVTIDSMPIDEIRKRAKGLPIIIQLPDGAIRPDNTLDREGKQLGSVGKFLMLKRDNGAENFNMKAKKLGDDLTNSIVKYFKYGSNDRFFTDWAPKALDQVRIAYQDAERRQPGSGKLAAIPVLAKHLFECDRPTIANPEAGYNGEMDIADYANVAALMIAEREDGTIAIRSLEQLSLCVRMQFDPNLMDSGDPSEVAEHIKGIVDAIGMDPDGRVNIQDALLNLPVHSTAQYAPTLRQRSSSQERNYDWLYNNILKEGLAENILSYKEVTKISRKMLKDNYEVRKRLEGLASRSKLKIRNGELVYNRKGKPDREQNFDHGNMYDLLGVIEGDKIDYIKQPGPQTMWYIGNGVSEENVYQVLKDAYKYGVTVAVDGSIDAFVGSDRLKRFIPEMVPITYGNDSENVINVIPFFDMRLNGSKALGNTGAPASYQLKTYDNVVYSTEDPTNHYRLGDAAAAFTAALLDRIRIVWGDSVTYNAWDMFQGIIQANPDSNFRMRAATKMEVQRFVGMPDFDGTEIDIGVEKEHRKMSQAWKKFDIQVKEYLDNIGLADDDSFIKGSILRADQIAGWVALEYDGGVAFAPVIPFSYDAGETGPSTYTIDSASPTDGDPDRFTINWRYDGYLEGQYFKVHEGLNCANKMMAFAKEIEDIMLKDGIPIDIVYPQATTLSRRLGSNRRIQTMITLMFTACRPQHGYNFAEHPKAFPNDPELRERLKHERIPASEWFKMDLEKMIFSSDPKMDSYIRNNLRKCKEFGTINPSDFLCSRFDGKSTQMYWEYEALFETTPEYEDQMLHFFHEMDGTLCPDGIDGDPSGCLFRVASSKRSAEDFGCLQMEVPHHTENGVEYLWQNVYASFSFMGEEFSGFHKPSVTAASRHMDALATMAHTGRIPMGYDFKAMLKFATAEYANVKPSNMNIEIDVSKKFEEEREEHNKEHASSNTMFRGENYFMSNMYPADVTVNIGGKEFTFTCAEAAFQAFKDPSRASEFVGLTGLEAKRLGHKVSLDSNWEQMKDRVMKKVVTAKFKQNPELLDKLKAVEGPIVENNNWNDRYWGKVDGVGKNRLGEILSQVRDSLDTKTGVSEIPAKQNDLSRYYYQDGDSENIIREKIEKIKSNKSQWNRVDKEEYQRLVSLTLNLPRD